jgi:DNA-binding NtrC family response regulator
MASRSHILVVEDDVLVSEIVDAALSDDYDTTVVESSADALECLRGGGIDLMLLDCSLPGGMDANLLPLADRTGVPVILMSGDPARVKVQPDRQRPFVQKPFSLTSLLTTVEQVIDSKSRAAA